MPIILLYPEPVKVSLYPHILLVQEV